MKQFIIIRGRGWGWSITYLRVQIVDLVDCNVDVASVNRAANLNSRLNRFLFKRELNIGFLCKLLGCPGVSLADQIIHDNEVDGPGEQSAHMSLLVKRQFGRKDGEANRVSFAIRSQVNLVSTRCFGEIPNLFLAHHVGAGTQKCPGQRECNLPLRRLDIIDLALEQMLRRRRRRHRDGGRALHAELATVPTPRSKRSLP
jgi:hypothetical protein